MVSVSGAAESERGDEETELELEASGHGEKEEDGRRIALFLCV